MAQAGSTPISLYYSTTAAAAPTAGNLVNGELAINITDGKLFYKDNSGVVKFFSASAGTPAGANTQVQFNNAGAFGASANFTFDGTNTVVSGTQTAGSFIPSSATVPANGLYLPAANSVALATNTTARLTIASNGILSVPSTSYSPNITLTDAATIAWDTSLGQVATFTFVTNNRTVGAPTNLQNGGFYALAVIQNAGGNTLTWNAVFKFPNGVAPTLTNTAGAKDYFVFRSDGTNMYLQGQSLGVA